MKIGILSDGIPPEGKGGAERIAWQSAKMLHSAGHEVFVITTTRAHTEDTVESVVEGITIFSIPTTYHPRWRAWISLYNPATVAEVTKILAKIQPEIVHAHNVHEYLSYAVLKRARRSGARVFLTFHDVMSFYYGKLPAGIAEYKISAWQQIKEYKFRYNPFRNWYIRSMLRYVHTTFAVSNALREALIQNGIVVTKVLYNGIDQNEWHSTPAQVESFLEEHALQGKKIILFGGRISGLKGGDALLAALPEIQKMVPNTILLIVGTENGYVRKLKKRTDGSAIYSTGWISGDALRAAYNSAHVVTVLSLYLDPLPTVVLEAMACGKPVVGSSFGGIPEMVKEGKTGYIVNPLHTTQIAERCVELLTNDEKAQEFGSAGAERQKEFFSEEHHLAELLAAYTA